MKVSLYRYFCEADTLLYVGIAKQPISRMGQHEGDKSWFAQVRFIEIEWFNSRDDALLAEGEAIKKERPKWNASAVGKPRTLRKTALPVKTAPKPRQPTHIDCMPSQVSPRMFWPPKPGRAFAVAPDSFHMEGVSLDHHLPPEKQDTVIKACRAGDMVALHPSVIPVHGFWEQIKWNGGYQLEWQ